MKKRWKIFAIVCGSIAGLGLLLCLVAFALGFRFSDTSSYINWFGWNRHYSSSDSTARNKGSMDGTGEEFTDVTKLEVDVAQLQVDIQPYDGNTIKVEHTNVNSRLKLNIHQEGNTLYVETNSKVQMLVHSEGAIKISIPESMNFSEVDLFVGAGALTADSIQTSSLEIEVGAGKGQVSNFRTNELSATCGAGELELSGESTQDVDLECGIGSMSYQATGQETDYNYDVECGIGSVQVGGGTFSGIAQERKIENGASKEMSIECGVGEVIVSFDGN